MIMPSMASFFELTSRETPPLSPRWYVDTTPACGRQLEPSLATGKTRWTLCS